MVAVSSGVYPTEAESSRSARQRANGLSILVVDDDDDSRELLATVLDKAGARVTQAESAAAAILACSASHFDVLVSDIGMPMMDGYELVRRLRADGESLPAIAVTAFTGPENRAKALAAGFQNHFPKPIDPEGLIDAVTDLATTRSEPPAKIGRP
jgi:CheY-like chemotaxis protein